MNLRYILTGLAHVIGLAVLLKSSYWFLPQCFSSWYTFVSHIVLCLLISKLTFRFTKGKVLSGRIKPKNKAVFITGCDSGFGNGLAKLLDSRGYQVFASCLFPTQGGALELEKNCSERLQVLPLDVRKDDSVKAAEDFVKSHLGNNVLWAVVNNAGILRGCSTELTSIQDFVDSMDVNAFGAVRVTKAFLPLLRRSKGRVVNLASLAGRFPAPHFSPYTMSKYATVGFSDCLRQELVAWGVDVISVEPDLFRTQLVSKASMATVFESAFASVTDEDIKHDYGEKHMDDLKKYFCEAVQLSSSPNVSRVLNALENAVSLEYPDIVYQPCRNVFAEECLGIYFLLPYALKAMLFAAFFYVTKCPRPGKGRTNRD